jgi:hypothetical protein
LIKQKAGDRLKGENVQTCNIDHDTIRREIIEHVAFGFVSKGKKTSKCHGQTGKHGDAGGVVSDPSESVEGGCFERAVDEETIMVWIGEISTQ